MRIFRLAHSIIREHLKSAERSDKWPAVRKSFLLENPSCAACGSKSFVQVHHVKPFHLRPDLELISSNLVTLCMGPNECHLRLGHGNFFKAWSPTVIRDIIMFANAPTQEAKSAIWHTAELNRIAMNPVKSS